MADRVRMKSTTTFQNDRVTVFRKGGPEGGEAGVPVTPGDEFETDVVHGKELARLGRAEPLNWKVDDVEVPPLEPHHQVSVDELHADRRRRARADSPAAAAVQANRADQGASPAVTSMARPAQAPAPAPVRPAAPVAPAAAKPGPAA